MNKSPAFQWYPKDILASARVQEMSLAEEGAYRRLLDFCWINGSIPADAERCARLIGKGATVEIAKICQEMFTPDSQDASRMIHDRLEQEREKQAANSLARQKASAARWAKPGSGMNGNGSSSGNGNGDTSGSGSTGGGHAKQMQNASKWNANGMQTQSFSSANASASAIASAFSSGEENGGGSEAASSMAGCEGSELLQGEGSRKFARSQISVLSAPKRETLDEYLLRKQLEYPEHDVRKVHADFVRKCGSAEYPHLKNTPRCFDKWIAGQDLEFESAGGAQTFAGKGIDAQKNREEFAKLIARKYGGARQ